MSSHRDPFPSPLFVIQSHLRLVSHILTASYSVFTSPNHAPIPNHLPTLIVTPHGQPHHTLYSYIHTNFNKETYLLTPSPQGDLCVAKMVPPPGSRGPGGHGNGATGASDPGHSSDPNRDRSVRCEASRNLKWSITNTGINAPVYKLTLPNPDAPGQEQPLFQISKPNPNAPHWTIFYFTYAGHLIPPKRIEFGKIQKNATQGSGGGGGGTRVTITGKSPDEKAVWQTLGEGNEDMVEWIVLCAALNVLDEEIIKAAEKSAASKEPSAALRNAAVPSSRPTAAGSSPPRAGAPPVHARPPPSQSQGGMGSRPPGQGQGPSPPLSATRPNPAPYQNSSAAQPPRSYSNPRAGAGPADPRGLSQAQQHARPPMMGPQGGYPQQQGSRPSGMPQPHPAQQMGFARPPPPSNGPPGGRAGEGYYGRPPPPPQGYPSGPGGQGPPPQMGFRQPMPPQNYRPPPQQGGVSAQPVRRF